MVLPILISVSEAPVSYFLSAASAAWLPSKTITTADTIDRARIAVLPRCRSSFGRDRFAAVPVDPFEIRSASRGQAAWPDAAAGFSAPASGASARRWVTSAPASASFCSSASLTPSSAKHILVVLALECRRAYGGQLILGKMPGTAGQPIFATAAIRHQLHRAPVAAPLGLRRAP